MKIVNVKFNINLFSEVIDSSFSNNEVNANLVNVCPTIENLDGVNFVKDNLDE